MTDEQLLREAVSDTRQRLASIESSVAGLARLPAAIDGMTGELSRLAVAHERTAGELRREVDSCRAAVARAHERVDALDRRMDQTEPRVQALREAEADRRSVEASDARRARMVAGVLSALGVAAAVATAGHRLGWWG